MKRFRLLSGVLALLCLLTLTACPSGSSPEPETWDNATWDEATWQ